MNIIQRAKNISDRYVQFVGELNSLEDQINTQERMLETAKKDHAEALELYGNTERGIEVMKKLIEKMSEKGIEKLKQLLAYGMAAIFEDKAYSVQIEISERGDVKTAEFYLTTVKDGKSQREKLRDSVGGGIQTVVSLILRIYFILVLKQRRIICLDESLSQLSDVYLDGLFSFLRRTIDDLGFRYLWVTHDTRFISYADQLYRVREGTFKKVRVNG